MSISVFETNGYYCNELVTHTAETKEDKQQSGGSG